MFEDRTYDALLAETLAAAPPGIDTRPGSVFYDAVSGPLMKLAKYYTDLDKVFALVFLDSATEEYLDDRATEHGVYRIEATPSRYNAIFTGTGSPPEGARFFADGFYFKLIMLNNAPYFEAEQTGANTNYITAGTVAVPVNSLPGITSATFGEIYEQGTNKEDDDSLRNRAKERISGPSENGNRQHYKTWCEEVAGVGRARIVPLWKGPNTVKGVIINSDGGPPTSALVERVQEYVDPDYDGDSEGDGLGEGAANLGAHFTAVGATELIVDISYTAVLAEGYTPSDAHDQTVPAVTSLLKSLALDTPEGTLPVLRISAVGAIINSLSAIIDYTDLKFNGASANIAPSSDEVIVLGEVTVNV